MTRNAFVCSLIITCWAGFVAFNLLERRTPYGGEHPQIIALSR